jgi:hypothetical protein
MTGRLAFLLSAAAAAWCALLVAGALTVPVYSSDDSGSSAGAGSDTLVGVNGTGALVAAALPLLVALACGVLLHLRCSRGSAAAHVAAWVLVGLLGAFAVLALLSIGIFVVPAVALLAGSAALTPRPAASA